MVKTQTNLEQNRTQDKKLWMMDVEVERIGETSKRIDVVCKKIHSSSPSIEGNSWRIKSEDSRVKMQQRNGGCNILRLRLCSMKLLN